MGWAEILVGGRGCGAARAYRLAACPRRMDRFHFPIAEQSGAPTAAALFMLAARATYDRRATARHRD